MKIEKIEDIQAIAQFLHIALGSVAEVQSQLYTAQDLNYISKDDFDKIHELGGETARLIAGFIKYLKGSDQRLPTIDYRLSTKVRSKLTLKESDQDEVYAYHC